MVTHILRDIPINERKKLKKRLEQRLKLLGELRGIEEENLKITKKKILNNKMVLKSQIPIESIVGTKK